LFKAKAAISSLEFIRAHVQAQKLIFEVFDLALDIWRIFKGASFCRA